MANDTWTGILAAARIMARDTSSTNPGVSDASYLVLFNRRYRAYYARLEPRVVRHHSTTCGLTLAVGGHTALTTPTNYARIHSVFREDSATALVQVRPITIFRDEPGRSALERVMDLRNTELGANDGTPNHVALVREATTTAASQGKWRAYFSPGADNTYYFSVIAEVESTDLAAPADAPDVSPTGAAFLTVMTAHDAACLLNRPADFRQHLLDEAATYGDASYLLAQDMNGALPRGPEGRLARG